MDCPLTEQCPIEGTAAAASLRASGRFRIEKKDIGHGLITRQHVEIANIGNADCLDYRNIKARTDLSHARRRLIAMQLNKIRPRGSDGNVKLVIVRIDKQSNDAHPSAHVLGDGTRLLRRKMTRRRSVEHEPGEIRAGARCCERIFGARQSADFHRDGHRPRASVNAKVGARSHPYNGRRSRGN